VGIGSTGAGAGIVCVCVAVGGFAAVGAVGGWGAGVAAGEELESGFAGFVAGQRQSGTARADEEGAIVGLGNGLVASRLVKPCGGIRLTPPP
jgi:hypothetical protein